MKPLQKRAALAVSAAFIGGATLSLCAQNNFGGFQDTPIVPGTKWLGHI